MANFDDLKRVLKRLEGMNHEQITGFLSEQGLVAATFTSTNYDAFAHCSETEKWEWDVFVLFLAHSGGGNAQGGFAKTVKSPGEWLGEEGSKFRKRWSMPSPSK